MEDYISKYGNWLNFDYYFGAFEFRNTPSGFETDNNQLLKHQEFENHIDNHIYQLLQVKKLQKETLELAEKILENINTELKIKP